MKKLKICTLVLCVFIIAAIFVSCGDKEKTLIESVGVKYSAAFSIEVLDEENNIKKVLDGENRELILVPRDIEVPAEYVDKNVVRTPIQNAIFLSSTQVCSLRPVDKDEIWDLIGGVNGGPDNWNDIPQIKTRLESGVIKDVGGDMGDPNYEIVQEINPDIVFLYTGSYPQTSVIDKLNELGINYAVDNEYMETDYLARMEWTRFILTFYNEDITADKIMENVDENIAAMKKAIEGLDKPKVIFGSEYGGFVSVSNPNSWMGNMMKDAGADYIFADTAADGLSMSLEDFILKADEADVIIYTSTQSFMPNKTTLFSNIPLLADVKAVQNDRLWQYSNAYWMSVDESDRLAQEMAAIFYPDKFPNQEFKYFVKMAD